MGDEDLSKLRAKAARATKAANKSATSIRAFMQERDMNGRTAEEIYKQNLGTYPPVSNDNLKEL